MKSHVYCALRVESHISSGHFRVTLTLREQTLKILRIVTLPAWSCFKVERGMPGEGMHALGGRKAFAPLGVKVRKREM